MQRLKNEEKKKSHKVWHYKLRAERQCAVALILHIFGTALEGWTSFFQKDIPTIGVFDDDEEEDGGGGGDCEGCNLLFISYKF